MALGKTDRPEPLRLRVGEVVEVKSKDEILSTLDATGAIDQLPFMPEMLAFCGKQLVVTRRADKSCDTVSTANKKLRRFHDTVHLDDTRCSGSAHGGCEAQCSLFWKEAWLRRVPQGSERQSPSPTAGGRATTGAPLYSEADLQAAAYRDTSGPEPIYRCQATDHAKASEPMEWYSPMQFVRDVRSGNVSVGETFKAIVWWTFRRSRERFRGYRLQIALFNLIQRLRGGEPLHMLGGERQKTPREKLDLVPGELVQIKTIHEIKPTLDKDQKNRGLYFDQEMIPFCDRTYRVKTRVNRIIDEPTGKMLNIPGDCIILEGTACRGRYHLSCPRAIYPYWREIWLRRVPEPGQEASLQTAGAESR